MSHHPIDPAIPAEIMARLTDIERTHDVRVLFACESGSRGWGFASPDSDYDVRFLYVHPLPWYLSVVDQRDVVAQPVSPVFDGSGWELKKALGLLRGGNASLIEWLESPVEYRADPQARIFPRHIPVKKGGHQAPQIHSRKTHSAKRC